MGFNSKTENLLDLFGNKENEVRQLWLLLVSLAKVDWLEVKTVPLLWRLKSSSYNLD